jgi:hypothetical protein
LPRMELSLKKGIFSEDYHFTKEVIQLRTVT